MDMVKCHHNLSGKYHSWPVMTIPYTSEGADRRLNSPISFNGHRGGRSNKAVMKNNRFVPCLPPIPVKLAGP